MGTRCAVKRIQKALAEIFGDAVELSREKLAKARELIGNARDAQVYAVPFAQKIALEIGLAEAAVVPGPMKSLNRIFEKAIGKLNGYLEDVPDVGRLRILIEKPEDVIALRKMFLTPRGELKDAHPDNKITVTEFQDNFLHPSSTGRIAIHIGLEVKLSGNVVVPYEIQVIHKDMVATERFTHDNYQRACEIERKAKAENRSLTKDEAEAAEHYRESNRRRYLADALHLDLYELRHHRHKIGSPTDLLHLVHAA